MPSYATQMQRIVRDYRAAGHTWPASSKTMAAWAIASGRWKLPDSAALNRCAEDLSRAMREEFMTDRKGRRVRVKHPVVTRKGAEQTVLWDDLRTAPRNHMEVAFAQRRNQIVGDCRQLKTDVDSFNDLRPSESPIQIVFNFTNDLAELEVAKGVAA